MSLGIIVSLGIVRALQSCLSDYLDPNRDSNYPEGLGFICYKNKFVKIL